MKYVVTRVNGKTIVAVDSGQNAWHAGLLKRIERQLGRPLENSEIVEQCGVIGWKRGQPPTVGTSMFGETADPAVEKALMDAVDFFR